MFKQEWRTYSISGKLLTSNRGSSSRARLYIAHGKEYSARSKTGTYRELTRRIQFLSKYSRMDASMTEWSRDR